MERYELQQKQSLPLHLKEIATERRIREWYEHWDGKVYVAFSGGLDSTVLLHQIRRMYPEVSAVFVDTGLEYPEIKAFVKLQKNITYLKPTITFRKVLNIYGYPIISKTVSRFVSDLTREGGNNEATKNLRITGLNRNGRFCSSMKLPTKWMFLVDAPFKISSYCCDVMKKYPFYKFENLTGKHPYIGTMAVDSNIREKLLLKNSCNAFNLKRPSSTPMGFWTRDNIGEYIKKYNVEYSKIYNMGENHTGCIFCMFGIHKEIAPNRFQRMKYSHPKLWKYCMDTLEIKMVLQYLGIRGD